VAAGCPTKHTTGCTLSETKALDTPHPNRPSDDPFQANFGVELVTGFGTLYGQPVGVVVGGWVLMAHACAGDVCPTLKRAMGRSGHQCSLRAQTHPFPILWS